MAIIETAGLCKTFRSRKRGEGLRGALASLFTREFEEKIAVHDVSFSLDPGEVVGYIGPNGAGKSTTIKMLTGILVPTSGTICVAGLVPHEHRAANAENIGVVFGQRSQLYWDLPLRDSFELLRSIYDVSRNRYLENLEEFSDLLALGEFMDTPVRQLSLGERMRGDFAAAMIHDPKIVFLDEPTIGLDVIAKEAIRAFVSRVASERGTTVVLTTHDLADVERLARRIILIDEGTVVYDGALERLREEYGTHRTLVVTLAQDYPDVAVDGATLESREANVVHLRFDRRTTSAEAIVRRVMESYAISDLALVEPELESIVRRIYVDGYAAPIGPVAPVAPAPVSQ